MLVLTGLPTLFPKLVEARTFAERMFRVVFLQSLNRMESEQAIRRPWRTPTVLCVSVTTPSKRSSSSLEGILTSFSSSAERSTTPSCRGTDKDGQALVPVAEIEQKLDTDFSPAGGLAQPIASAICCP